MHGSNRFYYLATCFAALTTLQNPAHSASARTPPVTARVPVLDTYHGITVTENYRWLEVSDDPKVQAWGTAQTEYARSILDHLPGVEAMRGRVTKILGAKTVSYSDISERGGNFFAIKRQPPKQQPFLVLLSSAFDTSSERSLVDPNVIDPAGGTSIDWYHPSPDGKLVAVSLSASGTEVGNLHLYDVATGKKVYEVIPRVNTGTAGGDLAWAPDSTGFYYTRHPRAGERPKKDMHFYQQVYYHKLGTPTDDDRYELGKDSPRIAETQLSVDDHTGRVLATIQDGDGGEFAHYLRGPTGGWTQFSRFGDRVVQAEFGPNNDLFIVSRKDAPKGKILHLPIAVLPDLAAAQTILPEGTDSIVTSFWGHTSILPTPTRLYVIYQLGGPTEIRAFHHDGTSAIAPAQLPVANVYGMVPVAGDDILFGTSSYLQPSTNYIFRPAGAAGTTEKTALVATSPVNFDDCEVVREFARSKDGTLVPVNIVMRKGTTRDGKNPLLATGYGGYGVSNTPRYDPVRRMLLDHGAIFAVANIRGGGEHGEAWHLEGNLTKKQNVFDDFAAVLHHLLDRNYTNRERLAIVGGSNGGLLMGALLTQHPDLVKAVVSYVGIYDMLRVELSPNGEFNITEFGTVKNKDQFKALFSYSPYHNVVDGTHYPTVLFITGENDPRVEPMQSRKMTARLQKATASAAPILLRTSASSGHGGDTALDERIEQAVDVYSFLFEQLGIKFQTNE